MLMMNKQFLGELGEGKFQNQKEIKALHIIIMCPCILITIMDVLKQMNTHWINGFIVNTMKKAKYQWIHWIGDRTKVDYETLG
jgi:hypothetical protein